MRHLKILLLALFILLNSIVLINSYGVLPSFESHLNQNLAFVSCYKQGQTIGWGSGIFVGEDKVLTAFHVGMAKGDYKVEANGKEFKAIVLKFNEGHDLMLLETRNKIDWQYIEIAKSNPKTFEKIYFAGFNTAKFPYLRQWYFSKINYEGFSTWVFPIWFGDSGGPAFDKDGRLISIITKIIILYSQYEMYTCNIGYGAMLEQIKEIMGKK